MEQNIIPHITHTEKLGELMGALAKAQGKINSAIKCKKNPSYQSNYADLPAIWDACKEPLSSNGLAIVQTVEGNAEQMYLTTILGHSSGEWIKSNIPLIMAKKDPQAMGSCITYARRYALSAMVGVCQDDEDDDGEAATDSVRKEEEKQKKQKIEPDLSPLEINSYLESNWAEDTENFRRFMSTVIDAKKWNFRKCIEAFKRNPDFTRKEFIAWLSTNRPI